MGITGLVLPALARQGGANKPLSVCPVDHLLGGLPAGRRHGLAQEALRLPGVRDAADRQTLRPGRRRSPLHHLQQKQTPLSRSSPGRSGLPQRPTGLGSFDKYLRRGRLKKKTTQIRAWLFTCKQLRAPLASSAACRRTFPWGGGEGTSRACGWEVHGGAEGGTGLCWFW